MDFAGKEEKRYSLRMGTEKAGTDKRQEPISLQVKEPGKRNAGTGIIEKNR
jgi:hypothetical protein